MDIFIPTKSKERS